MELSGEQYGELMNAIGHAYTIKELEMLLRLKLDKELDSVCEPGRKDLRIFALIADAQRKGWLCRLLDALARDRLGTALKALASRLLREVCEVSGNGHGPPPTDDLGDLLKVGLVGRRAFVDREPFRELMREFLVDKDARLLTIRGPSPSGKSASWYFIRHVANQLEGIRPQLVNLENWKKSGGPTPDDLMTSISSRLSIDLDEYPEDDRAQGERRSIQLTNWFVPRTADLDAHYWLVLDHLNRIDLRDDTVELTEQLAIEIEQGNCENISLILIGFPRDLRDDIEPFALKEDAAAFGGGDVKRHFRRLASQSGAPLADDRLNSLVAETFDGYTMPLNKAQMHRVAGRLARISARVARGEAA